MVRLEDLAHKGKILEERSVTITYILARVKRGCYNSSQGYGISKSLLECLLPFHQCTIGPKKFWLARGTLSANEQEKEEGVPHELLRSEGLHLNTHIRYVTGTVGQYLQD